MVDHYTKAVLTVIAVALVWLAAQQSVSGSLAARGDAQAVFIAQISSNAAKCLAAHISGSKGDSGTCIADW